MNVIKYLKENGIEKLKSDFKIKVREYQDLIVLNYDQLDSPKSHPISIECRMLILDKKFNVIHRSFDRFFNLNEHENSKINELSNDFSIFEKRDGSLVGIYHYNNQWNISSKTTAFGEINISKENPITFKNLILKALNLSDEEFQINCNKFLNKDNSYNFEITSPANIVVKKYLDYKLTFLNARNKNSFDYVNVINEIKLFKNIFFPQEFVFDNLSDCIDYCNKLKKLDEGFVIYKNRVPYAKLKSILYLTTVYFNDTGFKLEKIFQIILINEQDEFLTYFPQYTQQLKDAIVKYNLFQTNLLIQYQKVINIENQKGFAVEISNSPYKSLYFLARKMNKNPNEIFNEMSIEKKANFLASLK